MVGSCLCFPADTVSAVNRKAVTVKFLSLILSLAAFLLLRAALWEEVFWFSVGLRPNEPQQNIPTFHTNKDIAANHLLEYILHLPHDTINDTRYTDSLPPSFAYSLVENFTPDALIHIRELQEVDEDLLMPPQSFGDDGNRTFLKNNNDLGSSNASVNGIACPPVLTEWTLKSVYFSVPRLNIKRRRVSLAQPPTDRWIRILLSVGNFYDALVDATAATAIILGLSRVAVIPVTLSVALLLFIGTLGSLQWCIVNKAMSSGSTSGCSERGGSVLRTAPPKLGEPLLDPRRRRGRAGDIKPPDPPQQQQHHQLQSTTAQDPLIVLPGQASSAPAPLVSRLTDSSSAPSAQGKGEASTESSMRNDDSRTNVIPAEDYVTTTTNDITESSTDGSIDDWSSAGVVATRAVTASVAFLALTAAVLCSAGFSIWAVRSVNDGSHIVLSIARIVGQNASDWLTNHAQVSIGPGILQYLGATLLLYAVAIMNMCLELAVKPYEVYITHE